ncbi:SCO2524 family protein [Kitasatospora camelliae]|uniref:SCO2524 family protein n=1 Tax=Kitasatospora camelliae TaxID=3156397 RepID=A0AAU8JX86_9ACTN
MRIQPRQQLLEIWQAIGRASFSDKAWEFGAEGDPSSVSDAEQLLCILYPATELPSLRLDVPDETAEDVLSHLRGLGDSVEIPRKLVHALTDFMARHSDEGGATFPAGRYLTAVEPGAQPTHAQYKLGVVDAYSLSITLSLATLGFLKIFTRNIRRADLREMATKLEEATNVRLSAAMAALLRCFTVSVFEADSDQGRTLCSMVNQTGAPDRLIVQQLQRRLRPLRATIRDYFTIGLAGTGDLENENLLFECGWSWGVVEDAPPIDTSEPIGVQPEGLAQPAPYLYFTVVALDGIADLFSERTLTLGLLNEEQQRLAQALRLRWELTQQYWSAIARFDDEAWPLEDIPWRTTDQQESAYFSLLVASILVQDLVRRKATDDDLTRTVAVMEELALRSRTTRRMAVNDGALRLHVPGVELTLLGSERIGPLLRWSVSDFSAQLLKRSLQLSGLSRNIGSHDRLVRLSEKIMDHLWARRIGTGTGEKLWDDITGVYPEIGERPSTLSWNLTERVVECLVAASGVVGQTPIRSVRLIEVATDLLSEADHLLDMELMQLSSGGFSSVRSTLQQAEVQLQRARRIVRDRPGTACALALQVLATLDELVTARRAAAWRG